PTRWAAGAGASCRCARLSPRTGIPAILPLGRDSTCCPCSPALSRRPCAPKSMRSVTAARHPRRVVASGPPRRCGAPRQHHLCLHLFAVKIKRLHHWRIGEAEQEGGALASVDVLVEGPRRPCEDVLIFPV